MIIPLIMPPPLAEVERIITLCLAEDAGSLGDITARLLIPEATQARLRFIAREPLAACGLTVAARVFARLSPDIATDAHTSDGALCVAGEALMTVTGPARPLLTAERVALNLMQRLSAVATLTRRYVDAVTGTGVIILDTRKTMPGLRALDKYAVRAGGGQNHRMGLYDMILIKDNHIALCDGDVALAIARAQAGANGVPIAIECDTLAQAEAALAAGATRLLLDNMDNATLRAAVALNASRAFLEASGNMQIKRVRWVAETGVNAISVGRLTHSTPNVDIGLDVAL